MAFEFEAMRTLRAQILEFNISSGQAHNRAAEKIAQLAIRKVKLMTPVDLGTLRNNWQYHVLKDGLDFTIVIYNQTEYASFVENGHRIVRNGSTVGWVDGKFMLKLTKVDMERLMPKMWEKEIENEMRRIFGG